MLERAFPRSIDSLDPLFTFIDEFVGAEAVPDERAFHLQMALEELFTNAIKYSGGTAPIQVGLERGGEDVRFTLSYESPTSFDPTQAPEANVNLPIEQRRAGGLGIHLVKRVTRDLRYHHGSGTATITATVGSEG